VTTVPAAREPFRVRGRSFCEGVADPDDRLIGNISSDYIALNFRQGM
jgi:hypothetical protein